MPKQVSKTTLLLMARCDFLGIENTRMSSSQRLNAIKAKTEGRLFDVWVAVNGKLQDWEKYWKNYKRNRVVAK